MNTGISAINEQVQKSSAFVRPLFSEIGKVIVGQNYLVERLVIGLLANGHVLLEGVPGLAKTLSVKVLANAISVKFSRLQFTPDLLPADLIGTQIYNPQTGAFTTRRGPIFSNLVLADEINRAPAKVQSALLEAMQEKQITIGDQTFKLEEPFLVLATENPIEQEGTYPLPEAQVDRFMLKLKIVYPSREEERQILDLMARTSVSTTITPVVTGQQILEAKDLNTKLVFDLVYNPLETPLLRLARQKGIPIITGIEMFVQQGARQFEIFTGKPAPEEEMLRVVIHALRQQAQASSDAATADPNAKKTAAPAKAKKAS